jgi:4'-phosphopantetheinyl transferase
MKHLLACSLVDLHSAIAERLLARLPANGDLIGTHPSNAKRKTLIGRALVEGLLRKICDNSKWAVIIEPSGKPAVQILTDGGAEPAISIAHSDDVVAAVVSAIGLVGIDIERHDMRRDILGISELAFGAAERRMVVHGGRPAFFRLWTLREAIGKATGDGLALAADGTDRISPEPFEGAWITSDRQWLLAHCVPRDGLSLALAVRPRDAEAARMWSTAAITWFDGEELIAESRSRSAAITGSGQQP